MEVGEGLEDKPGTDDAKNDWQEFYHESVKQMLTVIPGTIQSLNGARGMKEP